MVVENLYRTPSFTNASTGLPFDEESIIQEALQNIYNRSVDITEQIEPNLYEATSITYRKAIDTGFGTVEFGQLDYEFMQALKENTDTLAAFKTHRQQNDIAALLTDEQGKLKPFSQFREEVESLIGTYNRNWLRTEYDTAVIRSRHAARWKDFERDADLFPNLKWLETTSPNPDIKVHIRFWGRIWAITSSFWKRHYPGDRWNCKCGITNTDEPITDNSDLEDNILKADKPDAGIDTNSGISGEIFTRTHPYVKEAYNGAKKAVNDLMKILKEGFYPDKKFSTRLLINDSADGIELNDNINTAHTMLSSFNKMKMRINEHVIENKHKNPEYTINGMLGDAKRIHSEKGITDGFKKAIAQECEVVIVDLDKFMSDSSLRINKLAKYLNWRNEDFKSGKIKECYVVYRSRVVMITKKNATKENILKELEKLKPQ